MQKDLKTQSDDDFEKLLQDFINGEFDGNNDDLETSNKHSEPQEAELPFPKEMDDQVPQHRLSDCQEKHKCNVYQDKNCSTILSNFRRKAPDIAKTHGTSCRSQDYAQFTAKSSSIVHLIK